jgi:hypothetical protein
MQKKNTTLPKKKATAPSRASNRIELHRQLARNISAALKNPMIPIAFYNTITEGITDLFNAIPGNATDESVEYIATLLDLHAEAQKGGTR